VVQHRFWRSRASASAQPLRSSLRWGSLSKDKPMITNVLLFGLLLGSVKTEQQDIEPQRPSLSTFGAEVASIGKLIGYKCFVPPQLEGAPIVGVYTNPVKSLTELIAFCRQLEVSVERNEERKELRFSVPQGRSNRKLNESIESALQTYINTYAPYRKTSYKECYEAYKRYGQLKSSASGTDRYLLELKEQAMLQGCMTRGRALLNSILDVPSGFDYVRPSSTKYALPISQSASTLMVELFRGESNEITDVMDHDQFDQATWDALKMNGGDLKRKEYRQFGMLKPIPFLYHRYSRRSGMVYISLRAIVPHKTVIVSSVNVPMSDQLLQNKSSIAHFPDSDKPFTPLMPFKYAPKLSLNSVGMIAASLKKNYVGWLDESTVNNIVPQQTVLSKIARDIQPSGAVKVSLDGEWISVKSNGQDSVRTSTDWSAFKKVQAITDEKPADWPEVQKRIATLSNQDCANLEAIKEEFEDMDDQYSGITSGIRLLRALQEEKSFEFGKDFDSEISKLTPEARDILMPWFSGEYVYAYYTHLLHPVNASALPKFHLQAKYSKESGGVLRYRIVAVVGSNGPAFESIWFSAPVRPLKK
jgi:hypothetical protein